MSNQIPKVIHYCWFGGNPKPELIVKCIESWRKYCPDYEIKEWNESNFDVNFCKFSADAYAAKKWAFVSDVARLKVVYDYGGIYMDTDVELRSPDSFTDFLKYNAFFFRYPNMGIGTGLGYGGKAKDPLLKELLDYYSRVSFTLSDLSSIACQGLNTEVVFEQFPTFTLTCNNQIIDNYAFLSEAEYAKFGFHHGAFSWRNNDQDYALRYARKQPHVSKFWLTIRSPAIFDFFKRHKLSRIARVSSFIVCDLFDYGILYWLVRIKCKVIRFFKKSNP